MTIKEARKIARRWLGSNGTALVEARTEEPCVLGVRGPFAVDVRGRGVSWFSAEADLLRREGVERFKRREHLARAARAKGG